MAARATSPTGTTRSLSPLPRTRTVPWLRSTSAHVEAAALRDADAGGIEQLEQRVVAAAADRRVGGHGRAGSWTRPWAKTTASAAAVVGSAPAARGSARSRRAARGSAGSSGRSRACGRCCSWRARAGEVRRGTRAPRAQSIARGDRVPAPAEKRREVAQVSGVAAHRVGRGAALDGQVLEEGGDGGVHHAPVTPRPSGRSPACIRTPRGCTRA